MLLGKFAALANDNSGLYQLKFKLHPDQIEKAKHPRSKLLNTGLLSIIHRTSQFFWFVRSFVIHALPNQTRH